MGNELLEANLEPPVSSKILELQFSRAVSRVSSFPVEQNRSRSGGNNELSGVDQDDQLGEAG